MLERAPPVAPVLEGRSEIEVRERERPIDAQRCFELSDPVLDSILVEVQEAKPEAAGGVAGADSDGSFACLEPARILAALRKKQAQRGELLYTLKHAFNGALTPMVQCLLDTHNLSGEELGKLESLIKAKKKSAKK